MKKTAPAVMQAMDKFALKATFITGLQQNGKYTIEEAYKMMKTDWKRLKALVKKQAKQAKG